MKENEYEHIFDLFITIPLERLIESEDPSIANENKAVYSAPVNMNALSRAILHELAEQPEKETRLFEKIKTDLSSNDPVTLWIAWALLWSVQYNFYKKRTNVPVPDEIVTLLKKKISENAETLTNCKKYQGANNPNGLYGEIERTDKTMKNKFGKGLLPDTAEETEMTDMLERVKQKGKHRFFTGATASVIRDFEEKNNIVLPESYKNLLLFSDGGDLFLPGGIQFYGVAHKPIIEVNDRDTEDDSAFIIGRLSNGDPILCDRKTGEISIYNLEAEKKETNETYPDFLSFLRDIENVLGI